MPHEPSIPSTKHLNTYIKVVDELDAHPNRGFDAIGDSIGESTKVIDGCLKSLERQGRVTLIKRIRRSVRKEITDEGRILYKRARQIVEELKAMLTLTTSTIYFGTTNTILNHGFARGIATFLEQWRTRVQLICREIDYRDLVSAVLHGRLNLAIGPWFLPDEHSEGVTLVPFGPPIQIALVCGPSHPFAVQHLEKINCDELSGELVIALAPGIADPLRMHIPGGCEIIEVSNYGTIVNLVREFGLGLVPDWRTDASSPIFNGVYYISMKGQIDPIKLAAYLPPDIDKPENLPPPVAALYTAL